MLSIAGDDEANRYGRRGPIVFGGDGSERSEIVGVSWALTIIASRFIAFKWATVATGIVSSGRISRSSAVATISGSIPTLANNKFGVT